LNLTDYALNAVTLSVTNVPTPVTVVSPAITNVKVLLSWGLDPTSLNTDLQSVFQIYTSHGGKNLRYQGLKFQFDTATTMNTDAYTVTLGICSTGNCLVL